MMYLQSSFESNKRCVREQKKKNPVWVEFIERGDTDTLPTEQAVTFNTHTELPAN